MAAPYTKRQARAALAAWGESVAWYRAWFGMPAFYRRRWTADVLTYRRWALESLGIL